MRNNCFSEVIADVLSSRHDVDTHLSAKRSAFIEVVTVLNDELILCISLVTQMMTTNYSLNDCESIKRFTPPPHLASILVG